MTEIAVRLDEPTYEQLPGMSDTFEVDPSIVLDGSNAEVGIRLKPFAGIPLDCEIFMPVDAYKYSRLEVYPLDGKDKPFFVTYDIGDQNIFEDETLVEVVKRAFVKLNLSRRFYN